jgi:hypothetical protein
VANCSQQGGCRRCRSPRGAAGRCRAAVHPPTGRPAVPPSSMLSRNMRAPCDEMRATLVTVSARLYRNAARSNSDCQLILWPTWSHTMPMCRESVALRISLLLKDATNRNHLPQPSSCAVFLLFVTIFFCHNKSTVQISRNCF